MKTSSELDTYLRLKYGYPLTKDSYILMPEKLVKKIYLGIHRQNSTLLNYTAIRNFIESTFIIHNMFPDQQENKYCSEKVWEIIKRYHQNE